MGMDTQYLPNFRSIRLWHVAGNILLLIINLMLMLAGMSVKYCACYNIKLIDYYIMCRSYKLIM